MSGKNVLKSARFAGSEEFTVTRLAALLEDSYASLNHLFTASELLAFIVQVQDWEFDDSVIRSLDDVAFNYEMAPIGKKLMRLSLLQKHALVDVIELSRTRNPGEPIDLSLFDELGVKLKAEALRERSGRFAAKMGSPIGASQN